MEYTVEFNGIKITSNEELNEKDYQAYVDYVKHKNLGREIVSLGLAFDGDDVDLSYELAPIGFEKIRRITGYLVGDMSRWNNAKSCEEHDRVKHA